MVKPTTHNGHEDRDVGGNRSRNEDKNRRVEGRNSPRTCEVVIDVGRKTRESRGRRQ